MSSLLNLSQSYVKINNSTILGVRELLNASSTRPPMIKQDSEGTVDMGTAKTSRAILDSRGNLSKLIFHHLKRSRSPSSYKIASLR